MVVSYKVKVAGQYISKKHQVMAIHVYKEVFKIPTAIVEFANGGRTNKDKFTLAEDENVSVGAEVVIELEHYSRGKSLNASTKEVFKGIIVKTAIKSTKQGRYSFTIECKDPAFKMLMGRKYTSFQESKDADIISQIINEGYKSDLKPKVSSKIGVSEEFFDLYNVSDWDAIAILAERNGAILKVDNGEVYVDLLDDIKSKSKPKFSLDTNQLLGFDIKSDTTKSLSKVTVQSLSEDHQTLQKKEETISMKDEWGGISSYSDPKKFSKAETTLQLNNIVSSENAQRFAKSVKAKRELAITQGYFKFNGFNEIPHGSFIEIEKLNKTFNGIYFISGIEHEFSEGDWTTKLLVGMSEQWYQDEYNIQESANTHLIPPVKGLMIGTVETMENYPFGYRFKVRIPTIHQEKGFVWARVASLYSTKDAGMFFMPEKEDSVVVGFVNDSLQDAIILGVIHRKERVQKVYKGAESGTEITMNEDNFIKSITTKTGLEILFNDEDKLINISTPKGKTLILDDKTDSISVTDNKEKRHEIIIDSKGITIKFKDTKVLFDGKTVEMKLSDSLTINAGTVEINASKEMKLNSSSKATLSGSSSVEVKSSGSTKVDGSIINIG